MLGIVGAMDIEVSALKKMLQAASVKNIAGIDFACGSLCSTKAVVAQCNPGKVNAALCTQIMIDLFGADCIINIGVGCSLSGRVSIGDIVIATDVCQHDFDLSPLGSPLGFIDGIDAVKIETSPAVSDALAKAAEALGYKLHRGTIASGDVFIASSQLKSQIVNNFGAVCGEMEGGAVGHVCRANGVPFSVLRSVSDGGDETAQLDFPSFKKIAAEKSTAIISEYVKSKI
ncbi:MAG: 5'-methylthioadenosine/adenosylhomocysteine nucleosidase [Clostridiales bacterium]|nr:5'-methylthioadenosine/adenosylhomocysteine nucleosidase [Clostridiales bacterium]